MDMDKKMRRDKDDTKIWGTSNQKDKTVNH